MNKPKPPLDGSPPCPFCPVEVRNLHAVAHNLLTAWDDPARSGKIPERIAALRDAVAAANPLSDAHFASRRHSLGQEERPETPVVPEKPMCEHCGEDDSDERIMGKVDCCQSCYAGLEYRIGHLTDALHQAYRYIAAGTPASALSLIDAIVGQPSLTGSVEK